MSSKRYRTLNGFFSGLLALALAVLPVQWAHAGGGGGIIRYAKTGGLSSGSCSTWATACKLQRALSVSVAGDQVWVAKGTYKPTPILDRTVSFHLKTGVAIYGGFLGTETSLTQRNWKVNATVLSGDIGMPGAINDNSYHVVIGDYTGSSALLDGFRIVGGNADNTSYLYYVVGGGMITYGGSPTLRHLRFLNNFAIYTGGGMYNATNSNPALTDVIFSGNVATQYYGGGMYNNASSPKLANVTFSKNSAGTHGGGMANENGSGATLTNVTFSGNSAAVGAGMSDYGSNPVLTNVTFAGNIATGIGGGIYNTASSPKLTNVTLSTNSAYQGGGMDNENGSSPKLTNVTFSGNSAAYIGGAMYNSDNYTHPTLTNATFSGNSAVTSGGAIYNNTSATSYVDNSIFWYNGSSGIFNFTWASAVIADSIVEGGCPVSPSYICTRVIDSDPLLGALKNNGGFTKTIAPGDGAAIDVGNSGTCAPKDQRGVARPQGLACDMGALEVRAKPFLSQPAYDGWVRESTETSNIGGGSPSTTGTTLRVGDDAFNRQYRSVVSFNTATLPDTAIVIFGRLMLSQQGIVGTNPFTTHSTLMLDLVKPYFGAGLPLVISDFQAPATVKPAGMVYATPTQGFFWGAFNSAALSNINRTGTTQLRLRFWLDDNNDHSADYIAFYSGESSLLFSQPALWVYYVP